MRYVVLYLLNGDNRLFDVTSPYILSLLHARNSNKLYVCYMQLCIPCTVAFVVLFLGFWGRLVLEVVLTGNR